MHMGNVLNLADLGVQSACRPPATEGSAVAGSPDLELAAVGERQWSWPEPGTASGAIAALTWRNRMLVSLEGTAVEFLGGSGWPSAHWEPDRADWPVQRESTATGADLTGWVRTAGDGDLHRRTAVDVLPVDGMQEVRGSNPRSSTGQEHNSKTGDTRYSRKVQQRQPDKMPCRCSDQVPSALGKVGGWRVSGAAPLPADQDKCFS
jgi:hypothetical protein